MSGVNQSGAAYPATLRASEHPVTLRWIVKRTALAVTILALTFGSIGWLTYQSIDQNAEAADASETAKPQ